MFKGCKKRVVHRTVELWEFAAFFFSANPLESICPGNLLSILVSVPCKGTGSVEQLRIKSRLEWTDLQVGHMARNAAVCSFDSVFYSSNSTGNFNHPISGMSPLA